MSWDIGQAIRRMTRGGEKSRLSWARLKGFRRLTCTRRPATTLTATDPMGWSSRRGFLALLASFALICSAGAALAQIPSVPNAPPPPPRHSGSGQNPKIRGDVNLVVLQTTVIDNRGLFPSPPNQQHIPVLESTA